jgi:hypothetical protein
MFDGDGRSLPEQLSGLDQLPVGADLVARLAAVDYDSLDLPGLLAALAGWARVQAWASGEVAVLTAATAGLEGTGDPPLSAWQLQDEVSAAVGVSPGSAGFRIERAESLAARMPALLGLLRSGRVGMGHIYAVRDALERIADDDCCRRVDEELARLAGDRMAANGVAADRYTPGELARHADRLVARAVAADPDVARRVVEPAAPERFCRLSKRGRSLYARFSPDEYVAVAGLIEQAARRGIDTVCGAPPFHADESGAVRPADGPAAGPPAAATVVAVDGEGLVRLPADGDGEAAVLAAAQIRQVDALVDLLLGRPVSAGRPAASVGVLVPASTLAGGSEPGALGDGSVLAPETARRLSCDASLYRLLLEPDSGRLLDAGRSQRQPGARLRAFLVARDGCCRFPGCPRPAQDCDVHHFPAWSDGGTTDRNGLLCLCPRHHVAVHEGGWRVTGEPEGVLTFTSPAGQIRTSRPQQLARHFAVGEWGVKAMAGLAVVQPARPAPRTARATGHLPAVPRTRREPLVWLITEPDPNASPPAELAELAAAAGAGADP